MSRRSLLLPLALTLAVSAGCDPRLSGVEPADTGSGNGTDRTIRTPRSMTTTPPSATPRPATRVSPVPGSMADRLREKLLNVARVQYAGAIASIVSNNGGGLISDKGMGIIANNGGSLISNNGGGLVSNNGGGYRVLALHKTINEQPEDGETLLLKKTWPDGSREVYYVKDKVHTRWLGYFPVAAIPLMEIKEAAGVKDAQGRTTSHVEKLEVLPDGRFGFYRDTETVTSSDGHVVAERMTGEYEDPRNGIQLAFHKFEKDRVAMTLDYKIGLGHLKLVEAGRLTNLTLGQIIDAMDPLETTQGQSEVSTAAGVKLYAKTQRFEGARTLRDYDLLDGFTVHVARDSAMATFTGDVKLDGERIGAVTLTREASGAITFHVTLDSAPDEPLVIRVAGGGVGDATPAPVSSVSPTPRPSLPPNFRVSTLAGNGTAGFADGAGAAARFKEPLAVAETAGFIYVADTANHRVRRLDKATGVVTTIAGDGVAGLSNGPATAARFNGPAGLAVAADGTLYVSELRNHTIRKITPGGEVSTLAGSGTAGFADGTGAAATFNRPAGMAFDAAGDLLVADQANHRIRKVTLDGVATTIAGTGEAGYLDGPAATAKFKIPFTLCVKPDGTIVVADTGNFRVRALSPAGQVTTLAGDGGDGGSDGPGQQARFSSVQTVVADSAGNVYASDSTMFDVRRLSPDGQVITIAGVPIKGLRDGLARDAMFNAPFGLALFEVGGKVQLVVADSQNHAIRRVQLP